MSEPVRDAVFAAAAHVAALWKTARRPDSFVDWDTMQPAIEALATAYEEGCTTMKACPLCGCTDIETVAWVHVNSNIPSMLHDMSDRRHNWCPQCETNFPVSEGGPPVVGVARPYDQARDLEAEGKVIPEEFKV